MLLSFRVSREGTSKYWDSHCCGEDRNADSIFAMIEWCDELIQREQRNRCGRREHRLEPPACLRGPLENHESEHEKRWHSERAVTEYSLQGRKGNG